MKGVRCSWVDAKKRAEQLRGAQRGDQERLRQMVCVGQSTVSDWATVGEFLEVTGGKNRISDDSSFQPQHAVQVMRHFRKRHGKKSSAWDEEVIDNLVEWGERVEAEELTVKQLRELLKDPGAPLTETEAASKFADFVEKLLEKFPRDRQAVVADYFNAQLTAIRESINDAQRGEGEGCAGPDSGEGESAQIHPFSRASGES